MSKIGRKPISFKSAKVDVKDRLITISSPKVKFVHELPEQISVVLKPNLLKLDMKENTRENRILLGLHRALIANKIKGVEIGFEQKLTIVGLGFKAQLAGKNLTFNLGYTHKIDLALPDGISVEIDKTGQHIIVRSADKFLLGNVCDRIRSFRFPEPYKGTGIIKENEIIKRKAGKTKVATA
jgi:large subunit ribosomal protein L6